MYRGLISSCQATHLKSLAILGVPPNGSLHDIRKAYLNLARKYHPDTTELASSNANNAHFIAIKEAYDNLKDTYSSYSVERNSTASDGLNSSPFYKGEKPHKMRTQFGGTSWWDNTDRNNHGDSFYSQEEYEKMWETIKCAREGYRFNCSDTRSAAGDEGRAFSVKRERMQRNDQHLQFMDENFRPRQQQRNHENVICEVKTSDRRIGPLINGTYVYIKQHCKRPCFRRLETDYREPVYLYYSGRFSDWKISQDLRDNEECIAFCDSPYTKDVTKLKKDHWFAFNEKFKKFETFPYITVSAVQQPHDPSCEQTEESPKPFSDPPSSSSDGNSEGSNNKEGGGENSPRIQLCSRQKTDGTYTAPPRVTEGFILYGNRIEEYTQGQCIETWLNTNGQKSRVYSIYDTGKYVSTYSWKKNFLRWGKTPKSFRF